MPALAAGLGVGTMSLYRHVADKDDLLNGMVASVLIRVEVPPGRPGDWEGRVVGYLRSLRAEALRHPALARILADRGITISPVLDQIEATLGILRAAGHKVVAVQAVTAEDVLSVNDRDQQAQVDAIMQDRIQRQIRQAGVTIVSGVNTYIEAGATIGPDSVIRPFTFVGRDSSIGAECTVGPFACVPAEGIVPDGTAVSGNIGSDVSIRATRSGTR